MRQLKRFWAVFLSSCMVLTAAVQPGIPGCVITAYGQEQNVGLGSNEDKMEAADGDDNDKAEEPGSGHSVNGDSVRDNHKSDSAVAGEMGGGGDKRLFYSELCRRDKPAVRG